MPHAALWVVQPEEQEEINRLVEMFQCRTRLCGWCSYKDSPVEPYMIDVSMPHAALWVVQLQDLDSHVCWLGVSMPHAALWVVQQSVFRREVFQMEVSMPHAALWVVQLSTSQRRRRRPYCFNAARGFVGGAAIFLRTFFLMQFSFNAARGFVGGAARLRERQVLRNTVSMPHAALWVVQLLWN